MNQKRQNRRSRNKRKEKLRDSNYQLPKGVPSITMQTRLEQTTKGDLAAHQNRNLKIVLMMIIEVATPALDCCFVFSFAIICKTKRYCVEEIFQETNSQQVKSSSRCKTTKQLNDSKARTGSCGR